MAAVGAGLTQVLYLDEPDTYAPISVNDIHQDELGDCFLVAAIGELALNRPDAISSLIQANPDGTEGVTLYESPSGGLPQPYDTSFVPAQFQVNNLFPDDSVNSGADQDVVDGQKESWVQIIENAVAQEYGGYDAIANGGSPLTVMQALTGQSVSFMTQSDFSLSALQGFAAGGDLLVFDTPTSNTALAYDLIDDHAYNLRELRDRRRSGRGAARQSLG